MLDLQTAYFRTPEELQTWDLVENDRLDELELPTTKYWKNIGF